MSKGLICSLVNRTWEILKISLFTDSRGTLIFAQPSYGYRRLYNSLKGLRKVPLLWFFWEFLNKYGRKGDVWEGEPDCAVIHYPPLPFAYIRHCMQGYRLENTRFGSFKPNGLNYWKKKYIYFGLIVFFLVSMNLNIQLSSNKATHVKTCFLNKERIPNRMPYTVGRNLKYFKFYGTLNFSRNRLGMPRFFLHPTIYSPDFWQLLNRATQLNLACSFLTKFAMGLLEKPRENYFLGWFS